MKTCWSVFQSSIICLAFLFRLIVISFIPGSTATVFPHTISIKYKGLSSFHKRRRNAENVISSNEVIKDASFLSEENEPESKRKTFNKYVLGISVVLGKLFLATPTNIAPSIAHFAGLKVILQTQKGTSISILRI